MNDAGEHSGPFTQLISYIAHAAPATRRPACGDEPYLRPEIGFTPRWYADALPGLDFGERWHTDPAYRADSVIAMAKETRRRFGRRAHIGALQDPEQPTDFITGVFGALIVPALYGAPIWWQAQDWPWTEHGQHLDDAQVDALEPPDLDNNAFWQRLWSRWPGSRSRRRGWTVFVNWQSVINSGYRLRGEAIFTDMVENPARVQHLFACLAATMIDGARRLYAVQAAQGVRLDHFTVSNCLVNMLSPSFYARFVLPYDRMLAEAFAVLGIHNCAWNADPYVPHYASIPNVAYVDMGLDSNLAAAKAALPEARRALMYTPMDVANKSSAQIRADLERIARDYGPCDLVCADIDIDAPDSRVLEIIDLCEEISERYSSQSPISNLQFNRRLEIGD
jgi:hypothetical protein